MDNTCVSDEFTNRGGFRLVEIKLRDVRGIEVHGYRLRSSSISFPLSLTCGILSQIFCIDAKMRFFFAGDRPGRAEIGRSSATGSPRFSITITPPSAAS